MKFHGFSRLFVIILLTAALITQYSNSLKISKKYEKNQGWFDQLANMIEKNTIKFENEDQIFSDYASAECIRESTYKLSETKSKTIIDSLIAEVSYYNTINEKGWDKISLNTYRNIKCQNDDKLSPFIQAYIGGYLEGRIESKATNDFFNNMDYNINRNPKNSKHLKQMKEFFKDVDTAMLKNLQQFDKIYSTVEEKQYYYKIYIFYSQLHGYLRGHNQSVQSFNSKNTNGKSNNVEAVIMKELSIEELLVIQADGEIPELIHYFNYKSNGKTYRLGQKDYFLNAFDAPEEDPVNVWKRLKWRSRCSAMIKLLKDDKGNVSDILTGHVTWTDYSEIYRIIKHNKMELNDYSGSPVLIEVIFSSYPGCLSSTDDYYVTNNKLVVTETTLDVIDMSLYDNINKDNRYIPNFMRVNSATYFSKSAEEWVKDFKFYNSGTYSSQWMIVDYNNLEAVKKNNKFEKVLYVLEQTPDSIISYDVSKYLLDNGYYASFNRAFFSETNASLHTQLIKELYGDIFTFQGSARGKIFKYLEKTINNMADFKNALRYNGYKLYNKNFLDDPSKRNAGFGISARYDLDSMKNLSGGVDCKISNSELVAKISSPIISGPTTDNNPNLSIFDWSNQTNNIRHKGVPDQFDFRWYLASPENLKNNTIDDKFNFN